MPSGGGQGGSKQTIVDGGTGEVAGRPGDDLAELRDEVLLELVKVRLKQSEASAPVLAK